jgi:hypothetical protein
MITKLLGWFILSYGLMNIVVFSSIFSGFRQFFIDWGNNPYAPFNEFGSFIAKLITCPMCFSFHGGWFLTLTMFSPTFEMYGLSTNYSWFFDAILSSGAVWIINSIVEWFEQNRPVQQQLPIDDDQEIL